MRHRRPLRSTAACGCAVAVSKVTPPAVRVDADDDLSWSRGSAGRAAAAALRPSPSRLRGLLRAGQ